MYSWKRFKEDHTYYDSSRDWVDLGYIENEKLKDYFNNYDFSKFFSLDAGVAGKDISNSFIRPGSEIFERYKGAYLCTGITTVSYGDWEAFGFIFGAKKFTTKTAGYINDYGVKIAYEIGVPNTHIFVSLKSVGLSTDYVRSKSYYIQDTYRVTSSNPNAYPNAGVKDGYLYIKEYPKNSAPLLGGNVSVNKYKANGKQDKITVSWTSAIDEDNNFEAYRLYAHKGSNTELIYTGGNTSYTYRISGATRPYDLRFSVEAFDSEGEKSDRIQSSTVSIFVPSAPRISGNDSDLGTKNNPFDISYIVEDNDEDDSISVTIKVDDNVVKTESAISTGFRKTFDVDTKPLSFGKHTVTIIAKDKYGGTDTRIYTFTKSNKAPTISGYDTNLGEKRSAFSVKYTIHDDDNDSVTVVEKLNGSIRRTLSNVQKDTEISINISESDIKSLTVGNKNTIEIMASDSRGATAFRRYYFTRNNLAPVISGNDKDMGVINDKFEYVFSISDVEKDTIYYSTYLDNKLLSKQVEAVDGKKYATVIEGMDMIKLEPGKHTFKIVAVDAQGSKSERIITFSRDVQTLIMMLKEPFATDVQSKKVLVAPGWDVAKGAECRVEVCNNGFDTNPTWEDATAMTELNKAYVFQNNRKTAEKWGVNIRLMIERKAAKTNSYITGIGGAFE